MRPRAIVPILLLLGACGPQISVSRAPDAPIAAGSGWAFAPADRDGPKVADGAMQLPDSIARLLEEAIRDQLVAQGFPVTSRDSARFFVHYHVAQRMVLDTLPPREEPQGVRSAGRWGGYGAPEDLEGRVIAWNDGLLVIDALTPGGIVAWRGSIAGEVPEEAERRPREAVRDGVRLLLKRFP